MKKLFLALMLLCGLTHAQNPTIVRTTNGLANYPSTIISGPVRIGLDTNLTGFAANTSPMWNGSAFIWTAAGSSGTPTNFTWTANRLTNTVVGQGFDIATSGPQTNSASSFFLNTPGAITLGDASAVQFFRESTGFGYSVRQNADPDVGFNIGTTLGLRGAASTGGTINSTDTSIIYAEDASAAPIAHILPTVGSGPNKFFKFYKNDTTTNICSIATQGGTLMSNGATNYVLRSKGESVTIWCNPGSSTWDILGVSSFPKTWSGMHMDDAIVTGNAYLSAADPLNLYNFVTYQSTAAINDRTRTYVYLKRGTYTYRALGTQNTNGGIETLFVDGTSVGTIDWYAAVIARNVTGSIASIVITEDGCHRLDFVMATKNASSSDYYLVIQKHWLTWTAD